MKKFTCSTLIIFFLSIVSIIAQNPGCDGFRYIDDTFQDFKKTTVAYAPTINHLGQNVQLSMDVYEPLGDSIAARPVVVMAHGGSFIFGDRTMMARYCELLAKKGYVAATITYRLYPFLVLGLPDSLDIFDTAVKAVGDMRAAVRYFREDATTTNQFRADSSHIFIGGYSAGAVTALHYSYLDDADAIPGFLQTLIDNNGGLEGISGTASNKTYSSVSGAVVSLSGGLYRSFWIEPTESPIVSIHGTADGTVPYVSGLAANIAYLEGSSLLHQQATNIGLWNSLHTVPGGGHTDIYDNASFKPHLDTFWVNASTLLESLTCSTVSQKEPFAWDTNWSIAPNPSTSNQISIRVPGAETLIDVQLLNILGQQVYAQKSVANNGLMHLPKLESGVYIVQVSVPNKPEKRYAAKKLIVE